jgi:hypothetical protein
MKLKNICSEFLECNLNVDNVTKVLYIADLHNCKELKEKAVAFLGL